MKRNTKFIADLLRDNPYQYYYNDRMSDVDIFKEACRLTRQYYLNCSDFYKDWSPEGRERVFRMYLNRLKEGRK